jgi:hypothetical protein
MVMVDGQWLMVDENHLQAAIITIRHFQILEARLAIHAYPRRSF